jgi:hypothetical protein
MPDANSANGPQGASIRYVLRTGRTPDEVASHSTTRRTILGRPACYFCSRGTLLRSDRQWPAHGQHKLGPFERRVAVRSSSAGSYQALGPRLCARGFPLSAGDRADRSAAATWSPLMRVAATHQPVGPLVLLVLDGVGVGRGDEFDAVATANTPTIDRMCSDGLTRTLRAHGPAVGLARDTDMGNSEVGHIPIAHRPARTRKHRS